MTPERYGNADSAVTHYAIGPDFIAVQFRGSYVYVYDGVRPGAVHVARMKALAIAGRGLGTYINQHVRTAYARKRRTW